MAKTRIYELARELGLENKALLDLCEQVGVEGKTSHSNSLSDDEAERLRRAVIRRAVSGRSGGGEREVEREDGTFTERRLRGNVIRRRKKVGDEDSSLSLSVEDNPSAVVSYGEDAVANVDTNVYNADEGSEPAELLADASVSGKELVTASENAEQAAVDVEPNEVHLESNSNVLVEDDGNIEGIEEAASDGNEESDVSNLGDSDSSVETEVSETESIQTDSVQEQGLQDAEEQNIEYAEPGEVAEEVASPTTEEDEVQSDKVEVDEVSSVDNVSEAVVGAKAIVSNVGIPDVAVDSEAEPLVVEVKPVAGSEKRLETYRKRHDIRAPKVLGKIELPGKKPAPAKVKGAQGKSSNKKLQQESPSAASEPKEPKEGRESVKPRDRKSGKGVRSRSGNEMEGVDEKPRSARKRKQVLRKDDLLDYDLDRETWRGRKDKKGKSKKKAEAANDEGVVVVGPTKASKMVVKIDKEITVFELAKSMGSKASDVIKQLMSLGVMANINQMVDFDTATLVATEFGFTTQNVGSDDEGLLAKIKADESEDNLVLRSPVVTVMGHVDHGKTSLLDAIRNTSVTDSEAGGITQHIGAYTVQTPSGGTVAFIDTPGHAAFTEMRGRGAKVTDIVVLVVAADDGVMPQTIEAINHAKAAEVPIIVAINKMDKEDANPDRVKQQLAEYDLIPEDWGGETIMVQVSAHTRDGIDDLLENLALQAEILELKADPDRSAVGAVVESRVDRGRGPVMTILVQKGTLKQGDIFVAGSVSGRVRAMMNHAGQSCSEAGPSVPVEVLGASAAPLAGEEFIVLSSEAEAKRIAEQKSLRLHARQLAEKGGVVHGAPLTLENFAQMAGSEELKELALIIKADVQGTVEAVSASLGRLSNEEVVVKVIHKGVGAITENDVQLATASNAIVIGFNVRAEPRAAESAEAEGVSIEYSRVIYELVELVESAINGLKAPVFREKSLGRVEVRETFKVPRYGVIAGSYVLDGTVQRGSQVRLLRDNVVVYEGKMGSLRRFKDDVKEVQAGYECGVSIEGYTDIKDGDIIEVYTVEQVPVV